ncbi:MAG: hypothetical protein WC702_04115 [Patescibacteria group bacterium]
MAGGAERELGLSRNRVPDVFADLFPHFVGEGGIGLSELGELPHELEGFARAFSTELVREHPQSDLFPGLDMSLAFGCGRHDLEGEAELAALFSQLVSRISSLHQSEGEETIPGVEAIASCTPEGDVNKSIAEIAVSREVLFHVVSQKPIG